MEDKKRRFPIVSVIVIVIGIILVFSGFLMFRYGSYALPSVNTEDIEKSFEAKEIENLSFDFTVGKFTVRTADTDKIEVIGKDVPEDVYRIEVSGNTFKVISEEDDLNKSMVFSFGRYYENTEFDIIIPRKSYNKVSVDCGIGKLILSELNAYSFDLDNGIGSVEMKDCQLGNMNVDNGIGEVDFSGKILGDMSISNGIGSAKFDIDGLKGDYRIEKDGNVDVDYSESGFEKEKRYIITADNGIGEIKLKFR